MTTPQQNLLQSSTLPPAQPTYVLRGHAAQIHSIHFLRQNIRLITADADGWVVVWHVPLRRPVAVWQAHKATILGVGSWDEDKIITHGRDSKLHVWQFNVEDESSFSTTLPIDDSETERKQPWLLHSLTVNTLNFCSFTMCNKSDGSVLIAAPGVQDGYVNVTSLPDEQRVATVPTPKDVKTGMVMAIAFRYLESALTVFAGYESGHVAMFQQHSTTGHWQSTYVNKAHSQPVLSLDICDELQCFFSSAADAIIARHPLKDGVETKHLQTKHAGQQSLQIRSDNKIFATAGWDGRIRVYSTKTMKELAVLKWHKEGCYALAFATMSASVDDSEDGALAKQDLTVSEQRIQKAQTTHWLAAGSKDGKVSLWDIY